MKIFKNLFSKPQLLEYKDSGYFELNKQQRVLLGRNAQILIKDETLNRAFDECNSVLIENMVKTDPCDVKQRDALHNMVLSLNMVKDMLREYEKDGKLEEVNTNESNKSTQFGN